MKVEDSILAACCSLDLSVEQRQAIAAGCQNDGLDWHRLYRAAIIHKIAPLVYRNLMLCDPLAVRMPEEIAAKFSQAARQNSMRNLLVVRGIPDVVNYFDAHAHDVLWLKHTAYHFKLKPLFDLTTADDTDLVTRPRAESLQTSESPYSWSDYHTTDDTWNLIDGLIEANDPRLRPLSLEIDNRLHHDVVWNGVIPIDFRRVWNDAEAHSVDGKTVYVPAIDDLILISAVNIFRKPFVRLRNLVEIRELIRLDPSFNWNALFAKARGYECDILLYSALSATQSILGRPFPDHVLDGLRPGRLRANAIERVSRRISSVAVVGETGRSGRGMLDFIRRLLAFDLRQFGRFVWFRLVLRRVARVIEH